MFVWGFLNPQLLDQLSLRLVPRLVGPNSIVLQPGFVSISIPTLVFHPEAYHCLRTLAPWYTIPVPETGSTGLLPDLQLLRTIDFLAFLLPKDWVPTLFHAAFAAKCQVFCLSFQPTLTVLGFSCTELFDDSVKGIWWVDGH